MVLSHTITGEASILIKDWTEFIASTFFINDIEIISFYSMFFTYDYFKGMKYLSGILQPILLVKCDKFMMTSSNGNIFRVTGHLCGVFTGLRWIPHTGQWCGALMFSLICAWINGWVNTREAGDLRRYHAHYDVRVMWKRSEMPHNSTARMRYVCFREFKVWSMSYLSHCFAWEISCYI